MKSNMGHFKFEWTQTGANAEFEGEWMQFSSNLLDYLIQLDNSQNKTAAKMIALSLDVAANGYKSYLKKKNSQ